MSRWKNNQLRIQLDQFHGEAKYLHYDEGFLIMAYQQIFKVLPSDYQQLLIRLTLYCREFDEQRQLNWISQWLSPEERTIRHEIFFSIQDNQVTFSPSQSINALMLSGILVFRQIDKSEYDERTFTLYLCKTTMEQLPEDEYTELALYRKINESYQAQMVDIPVSTPSHNSEDLLGCLMFKVDQQEVSSIFKDCQTTDVIRTYEQLLKNLPTTYRELLIKQIEQLKQATSDIINQQIFELRKAYRREEPCYFDIKVTKHSIIFPQTVDFLGLVCLGLSLFSFRDQFPDVANYFFSIANQVRTG